jgi:MFS family permease
MEPQPRTTFWMFGSAAFWFAQSLKWFVLLLLVLPVQVEAIVGPESKNAALGLVTGVGAIWASIGPFLFGSLSYRIPSKIGRQRLFLLLGGFATLLGLAALGTASSLPAMVASYLLLQVADDLGTGPYAALIPERVPEDQRGKASGILGGLRFFAQVVGAVMGALLAKNLAGIYVGMAVANLLCLAITLWFLKGEPAFMPGRGEAPSPQSLWRDFLAPWSNRDFTLVFAITWIGNLGYYLIQTYLQNFLKDQIGDFRVFGSILDLGAFRVDSAGTAVMFLGLSVSVVGIVGAVLATGLTDRIGRKRAITYGGICMILPLIPFALIHDFTLIVCLLPVFSIGIGIYQSSSWALVSDILPDRGRLGKDMGIWQAAFSSVQIGSGAVGVIIDGLNKGRPGTGYSAMFLIGAALLATGVVAVRRVRGST